MTPEEVLESAVKDKKIKARGDSESFFHRAAVARNRSRQLITYFEMFQQSFYANSFIRLALFASLDLVSPFQIPHFLEETALMIACFQAASFTRSVPKVLLRQANSRQLSRVVKPVKH